MQRGICPSPFQRFLLRQNLQLLTAVPLQLPPKGSLALGSTNTGVAPALSTSCRIPCWHRDWLICPGLCHSWGTKQAADSATAPAAHSQTAQIVQLGFLQDCEQESLCWTSPLLMDYQDSQGIQPSFEDGEFTFHPSGLLAFVSHPTVPLSLPIFPWLLSLPGGRSRL